MWLKIVALLPFLLAAPDVQVDYSDRHFEEIDVRVVGEDELLDKCVKSGLSLQYDFEMRVCRRRLAWFDGCPEKRLERHTLSYDPISGNFRLQADRFGDHQEPRAQNYASSAEASRALAEVFKLPLQYLARGEPEYLDSERSYVSVRVSSECHGDYNKTLARISSFLTLGLVRLSGFDTGWLDFKLYRPESE